MTDFHVLSQLLKVFRKHVHNVIPNCPVCWNIRFFQLLSKKKKNLMESWRFHNIQGLVKIRKVEVQYDDFYLPHHPQQ